MSIIIADTGAIISLAVVGQIELIEKIFDKFYIAGAVWEEIQVYKNLAFSERTLDFLQEHIVKIKSTNYLSMVMDYGEAESVILYKEINADFLLIDDNKARTIAESLDVNCIGTIGLLLKGKQKGFLIALKPVFEILIDNNRFYSKNLLNDILEQTGEEPI